MMNNQLARILLVSAVSVLLAACSDPPADDSLNGNKATIVDGMAGNGMGSGGLKGIDLNTLGAMAALEDDKNYAVGGVQPTVYFGYDSFGLDDKGQSVASHMRAIWQRSQCLTLC